MCTGEFTSENYRACRCWQAFFSILTPVLQLMLSVLEAVKQDCPDSCAAFPQTFNWSAAVRVHAL